MSDTILATYDHLQEAQDAVNALIEDGFNRSDIGLAAQNAPQGVQELNHETVEIVGDIPGSEGVSIGAVFGSLVGAIAGLTAIIIPGIGPIIAAGPLAAALGAVAGAGIGAVSGAITGGVTASLVHLGVPADTVDYYAESLRRGNALVSVTVQEGDAVRATAILEKFAPVNMDQRVAQWRMNGWSKFDPNVDGYQSPERIAVEGVANPTITP